MASATYFSLWDIEQLKAAIFNAYAQTGAGVQACLELNNAMAGMQPTEIYEMCANLDNMGMISNSLNQVYPAAVNGNIANGVTVVSSYAQGEAAAIDAAAAINSNTTPAIARTATVEIPANFTQAGGATSVSAGAKVAEGATAGTTVKTVLGHVATGVIGTAVGLKLGVWIDGILYNANPDFWDAHNMSELNPATWGGSIIGNGLLKWADYPEAPIMMDDQGQMYATQEMFALMAQYLATQGAFGGSQETDPSQIDTDKFYQSYNFGQIKTSTVQWSADDNSLFNLTSSGDTVNGMFFSLYDAQTTGISLLLASKEPFTLTWNRIVEIVPYSSRPITTKDGTTLHVFSFSQDGHVLYNPTANLIDCTDFDSIEATVADLAYLLCFGEVIGTGGTEGINEFGTTPTGITPIMSIADILALLRQQFPDLFSNSLKNSVLQPDGTITDQIYLPIGWPGGGTDTQPISKPGENDKVDPKDKDQTDRASRAVTPPDDGGKVGDGGGDVGKGTTPPLVPPTGTADALYAIYNPTTQEVKSLGAWLWSSNFIDQLLKMFSNPMEAIISLHKIYGTPHVSGRQNIKVGYLDSGVASNVVDQQYITIDCGVVNMYENFGSVFDYNPFTELSLYLPFIGIVQLDVADVMRGKVNVIYHIDVITGAVLAEVKVVRDNGAGGVIYQYTGSCAEHYPLSAGSYIGIVTGAAGIAAGVAGTVLSGGALAPMLLGGAASVGSMHTNVQKSGGFTANAGAMGIKKPYFIVSRPQSAMSRMWQKYSGMGANTYVKLASCAGYTRVKYIHLDDIVGACREDLDAIEAILKEGVIV